MQTLVSIALTGKQRLVITCRRSIAAQLHRNSGELDLYLLQMPSEKVLLRSILPNMAQEERE